MPPSKDDRCVKCGQNDFANFAPPKKPENWGCNNCGTAFAINVVQTTRLPFNPAANIKRIVCIGHGTYMETDRKFLVPRNVRIRFRTLHEARTGGGNDIEVRADEDRVFGQKVFNYRLSALMGSESITLLDALTKDGSEFIKGWKATTGANTFVIVKTPGESICLSDIVYGLGGAASKGTGIEWEVVWLACRELLKPEEFEGMLAKHRSEGKGKCPIELQK